MKKRPLSVTIASWVLVAAGAVGLIYHLSAFKMVDRFPYETVGVSLVRVLAIIGGAFMLRGKSWARWLALSWIALHVVLSYFHSLGEMAMHALILLVFAYVLLRPQASAYFGARRLP